MKKETRKYENHVPAINPIFKGNAFSKLIVIQYFFILMDWGYIWSNLSSLYNPLMSHYNTKNIQKKKISEELSRIHH